MRLEGLVSKIETYLPGAEVDLLRRAYAFSAEKHKRQRRASGEPYVSHPLAVASILGDLKLDVASVVTGLLHDTVEDTLTTISQIEAEFGAEVANLVDGVTKISQINFQTREEHRAENIRKMMLAMSQDLRVVLIKLADRTHNMRTLAGLSPPRQAKVAQETLDIYAPLAHRLGIYWMKSELEDNALHALHPEVYYQLKRSVSKKKAERERYIREVQAGLLRQLEESGLDCSVQGRPKHFYSIYQKMRSQNLLFDQVHDLVAFRIIVDTVRECYEGLGLVHGHWKPVRGRFKDYIALAKGNGYQSLHTTVIGPRGERIEVQIRTAEMHRYAEEGVAAHWTHKEGGGFDEAEVEHFKWLRGMLDWQNQVEDPQEFLHVFREDLVADEVHVFTPKGDPLHFPAGATVIDFAYRIHSEVGHRCTGARVGGRVVPLRYQLQIGDTVEIITTQHQQPNRDWLKIVQTPRAKQRIREWIKAEQAARSAEVGREILDRDLSQLQIDRAKLEADGSLERVAQELGLADFTTLVSEIGYGKVTAREVIKRLLPADEFDKAEERGGALSRLFRAVSRRPAHSGIRVTGIDDVLVRFARCCDPLPGEVIVGLISRGRGVAVHGSECPQALEADPQRRVSCVWDGKPQSLRPIRLEVLCVDRPGLLAAISKAIAYSGVNIRNADAREIEDGKARNTFEVMVSGVQDLQKVTRNLGRVKGVMSVDRVRG